jgi:two-component system chemotaxis response regulator CheB
LTEESKYHAVVIGASAGGLFALSTLLEKLPPEYPFPVVVVQHRSKDYKGLLEEVLQEKCKIRIKQADEKEKIESGIVYIAPPDYHLLVETNRTFSLSSDIEVLYSRPSIDVLFESAAMVYKDQLIGIILTGSSNDGASGIEMIKKYGGITIAQNPDEAEFPYMPKASIETKKINYVWTLSEICIYLLNTI